MSLRKCYVPSIPPVHFSAVVDLCCIVRVWGFRRMEIGNFVGFDFFVRKVRKVKILASIFRKFS